MSTSRYSNVRDAKFGKAVIKWFNNYIDYVSNRTVEIVIKKIYIYTVI